MQKEEYEVISSYVVENTVIIEVVWTGTLAVPMGNIPAGGQIESQLRPILRI